MQRKTLRSTWITHLVATALYACFKVNLPSFDSFKGATGLSDLDSLLISTGCLSAMKTSSGIMSLLGKPGWHWRNWRWTKRKTSTCALRELSLWVKLGYIQNNSLFSLSESLTDLLPSWPPSQTKRTATAGGARGIALYEDEAKLLFPSMSKHDTFLQKFTQISSWIPLNCFFPPLLCLSRGKMAERWRSAAGFWCPSCTAPRPTVSLWVWCAAFTWLPWMLMATLTHMSKCR